MQALNPLELVTRQRITETAALLRPYIRRTPVIEVDAADFGLPSARISFKLELLQHTGSFKPRGAFANLLTREIPSAGIVAASGGNHGVAVAYAAMKLGKPATIFVPKVASPAKIERIRGYGAELGHHRRSLCRRACRQRKMERRNRRAPRSRLRSNRNSFRAGNRRL